MGWMSSISVKQRAGNETTGRAGTGKGRLHRMTMRTSSGKHRKMETGAAGVYAREEVAVREKVEGEREGAEEEEKKREKCRG